MGDIDMAADMVNAVIAGMKHGMKAQGPAFCSGVPKSCEDRMKFGAVAGIALQHTHPFTDDVHTGTASSAAVASGMHTVRKLSRKVGDVNVGTSVNVKPPATMTRQMGRFI
jgi:hypothetical protein